MNSIWVVAIVLTMNGQQPQKVLMLDGHAYASHGLCEVSGMIKIGNDEVKMAILERVGKFVLRFGQGNITLQTVCAKEFRDKNVVIFVILQMQHPQLPFEEIGFHISVSSPRAVVR